MLGSVSAELQASVSAPGPACATTSSQKERPISYWRIFISSPKQLLEDAPWPAALAPAAVHRDAHALHARQLLGADCVHHVLGVALDQRHRGLHALHQRPTILADPDTQQLAVA